MNRIEFSKLSFGERLKYLRNEKGISQRELSELSNVPLATIKKYEIETRFPKRNGNLLLISKALN